jgi:uncharacterized protein (UPF0548 family)
MLLLSKPDRETIDAFISSQKSRTYSYPDVGATQGPTPIGYTVDHNRVRLGAGVDDYARAKGALREWKMFDFPWVRLCWPDTPIEPGSTVAILVSHFGLWSLNACRVVYVIEDRGRISRFGFAYGTLPAHEAVGEERFTVEHDSEDDSVWYDIYAISRPGPLARLAYPFTRALQRRFAQDSKTAMVSAVRLG